MSESCASCLSCCSYLNLTVSQEDLQREPRLVAEVQGQERRLMPRFREDGSVQYTCPMLKGWGCSIYETRPQACRDFRRGSPACAAARKRDHKEPVEEDTL